MAHRIMSVCPACVRVCVCQGKSSNGQLADEMDVTWNGRSKPAAPAVPAPAAIQAAAKMPALPPRPARAEQAGGAGPGATASTPAPKDGSTLPWMPLGTGVRCLVVRGTCTHVHAYVVVRGTCVLGGTWYMLNSRRYMLNSWRYMLNSRQAQRSVEE